MDVYELRAIKSIKGERVMNAGYNDYAEWFPKGEETEVGDIIALDTTSDVEQYIKANKNSKVVVGVHSDEYGHIIGGKDYPTADLYINENNKHYIPVGLAGRVMVKFLGVAKKGMFVVPSNIDGVGQEWKEGDDINSVIGYIVENNYQEDVKLVKIKIK